MLPRLIAMFISMVEKTVALARSCLIPTAFRRAAASFRRLTPSILPSFTTAWPGPSKALVSSGIEKPAPRKSRSTAAVPVTDTVSASSTGPSWTPWTATFPWNGGAGVPVVSPPCAVTCPPKRLKERFGSLV